MSPGHAGCLARESAGANLKTHGIANRPEYEIWCAIKARCYRGSHASYGSYGARGIAMCSRWRESFADFLSDVGHRPPGKPREWSIERVDNARGYEPGNVRWATQREQCRNTRANRLVTAHGQTRTVAEWSEITGIQRKTISARLNAYGWDDERSVSEPVRR